MIENVEPLFIAPINATTLSRSIANLQESMLVPAMCGPTHQRQLQSGPPSCD